MSATKNTIDKTPWLTPESTLAIVHPAQPTTVSLNITRPFQWWGVKQGAVNSMAQCHKQQLSGGKEALMQWLICYPISGLFGAFAGLANQPAPLPLELDELEYFLGEGQPQRLIEQYAREAITLAGVNVQAKFHPTSPQLPVSKLADPMIASHTDAEIWLKEVKIQGTAVGHQVRLQLIMAIQVQLTTDHSPQSPQHFELSLHSQARSYHAWISDDYARIKSFVRTAAERLVQRIL